MKKHEQNAIRDILAETKSMLERIGDERSDRDSEMLENCNVGLLALSKLQEKQLTQSANPVNFEDLDQYINDLDNLHETGHFDKKEKIGEFTFFHKEFTMADFIIKGREFLRLLWVRER